MSMHRVTTFLTSLDVPGMRLWLSWPHSETKKLVLLRSLKVEASHLNTKRPPILSSVLLLDRKFPYPLFRPPQPYTKDSPRAFLTVPDGLIDASGS
ncbi:hypothetical protein BU25DRAFT_133757 [Macroventuria anomochaeta]|uniref:Uncharacterized protein n=1 Tax=Macroventuria anomochaeta TaxID=301207 RepID=A0ACB6RSL1_9PLEO|nr:uncharacterized protein BU25DRAFT_133757 [Macroventuria anomochaeta]KAF2624769.1 hypothetical protein BU25DRAFT_133757 [Macroventuria anomochaeta]